MRSLCCIAVLVLVGACGVPGELSQTGPTATLKQEGRENQGRENQGRENQGSELSGVDLKGWALPTLRKSFAGEPYHAPKDQVRVREGEVVLSRSLATGWTSSIDACVGTVYGPGRSCGWAVDAVGTCSPGTTVAVGSSGICGGGCQGDTMIRVCAGASPCEQWSELAENDDACGSLCSYVSFPCPPAGVFTVMTGSYASSAASDARPQAISAVYPFFNVEHTDLGGATLNAYDQDGVQVASRIGAVIDENPLFRHVGAGRPEGVNRRYEIELADAASASGFSAMCGGSAVDYDNVPVAPVVWQGYFTHDGAHHDDADWATFSCKRGVLAKVYRWGYRPWEEGSLALAAKRMAQADYCGDGRSFTMNGTEINLWDRLAPWIQESDPTSYDAAHNMLFEAAWTANGAYCLSHTRWTAAPPEVLLVDCAAPRDQFGIARECDHEGAAVTLAVSSGDPIPQLFNDSAIHDGGCQSDGGPF